MGLNNAKCTFHGHFGQGVNVLLLGWMYESWIHEDVSRM